MKKSLLFLVCLLAVAFSGRAGTGDLISITPLQDYSGELESVSSIEVKLVYDVQAYGMQATYMSMTTVVSDYPPYVTNQESGKTYTGTLTKVSGEDFKITFDPEITEGGTYSLTIPNKAVKCGTLYFNGDTVNDFFTIAGNSEPPVDYSQYFEGVNVVALDREDDSSPLGNFYICFPALKDEADIVINKTDNCNITLDGKKLFVSSSKSQYEGAPAFNAYLLTDDYITAPGDYTLNVSAGSFQIGNAENEVITQTFTIKAIAATSITLTDTEVNIEKGKTLAIGATVFPENTSDKTVTWTSSDESVATVSKGNITGIGAGNAVITATCGSVSATCNVTVYVNAESVTLDKTEVDLKVGETAQLTATVLPEDATDKTLSWKSLNTAVATVDADGLVTAVAAGSAQIEVSCGTLTATCEVNVTAPCTGVTLDKTEVTLTVNETVELKATVAPEGTTDTLSWTSSDEKVATVDENGKVTAVAVGTADITVTCGEKSATCKVTVQAEKVLVATLTLDITNKEAVAGDTFQLTATVTPSDATNQKLEWSSSDEEVATVDENGLVTVVSAGTCTITVKTTDGSNLSATCTLTATSGIASVVLDNNNNVVYSISGRVVLKNAPASAVRNLEEGIYVVNGKKVYIRR